jgi:hypothetical protein
MTYSLYVFPKSVTKTTSNYFIFDTPCGLEYSVKKLKGYIHPVQVASAAKDIQYTLGTEMFPASSELVLVVVATCNSECLRQVCYVGDDGCMWLYAMG